MNTQNNHYEKKLHNLAVVFAVCLPGVGTQAKEADQGL
jgi:hypothetical protein